MRSSFRIIPTRRLNAQIADEVQISHISFAVISNTENDSLRLRVVSIVPIGDLQKDKTLSADFPDCLMWNVVPIGTVIFPSTWIWSKMRTNIIGMSIVLRWSMIISYAAVVASEWGNVYGTATEPYQYSS